VLLFAAGEFYDPNGIAISRWIIVGSSWRICALTGTEENEQQ
jgi:hypothetical protein